MYKSAQAFINEITKRKTSAKVRPNDYHLLIDKLGNPQSQLKCIHVAGTNGKGSVTNYLRSILQNAGFKVGTFTSPHLICHNDRIRINDEYITDDDLLKIANQYYEYWHDFDLSMFEIDMIISVIYFISKEVDYVIYEVGIGGRLDPTNIITPIASVITNIGFDHMEYLGDTLAKIAYEKAGIIKDNGLVFTAEDKKECLEVFASVAESKHATIYQLEDIVDYRLDDGITFTYLEYHDVYINTIALYQIKNAALALMVADHLMKKGLLKINVEAIYQGLHQAFWKGRFEIVAHNPLTIIDGAHNEHGILALSKNLKLLKRPVVVVFSALKDKQYQQMINDLKCCVDEVIITHFENQRSISAKNLAKGLEVKVIEDYHKAIEDARSFYKEGSVVITGSLYFISLVRALFKEKE